MTDHNLLYYLYASCTNAQLPLLQVAALWFDKLNILDPVGVSWCMAKERPERSCNDHANAGAMTDGI